MAIEIPNSLVEFILLGPADDRRQLQDSPILGDVWAAFAKEPDACRDLLITPFMLQPAGAVAHIISKRFDTLKFTRKRDDAGPNIAYLQGIVAARFYFPELLRVVVPMTGWWRDRSESDELARYGEPGYATPRVNFLIASARAWHNKTVLRVSQASEVRELTSLDRYVMLAGLILWAFDQRDARRSRLDPEQKVAKILDNKNLADGIVGKLVEYLRLLTEDYAKIAEALPTDMTPSQAVDKDEPLVWHVSLNRQANPALTKSVAAVKADAARFLFKVDTSNITWAIIDSGIDGTHEAFRKIDPPGVDGKAAIRIKRSFDFKNFRRIVSLSNTNKGIRQANIESIMSHEGLKILQRELTKAEIGKLREDADNDATARDGSKTLKRELTDAEKKEVRECADKDLERLAEDAARGPASINWPLVERYVELDPTTPPATNHGTHVAGILAASKNDDGPGAGTAAPASTRKQPQIPDGMCPQINLFDFRVLGPEMADTEFAIIGALQYIRYLNDRDNFLTIHGANLSLSIPHDVKNFACGRTPICNECERLVESGVVVVAAAGNHGYKSFQTKEGAFDGYAAFSITDPGNADGVITVGATHRNWPHTYGISFFSSRGPTGDGRLKPDLVAPGERIRSTFPGNKWGDLDGTSMAAPHVSGAAAMLMARYSELVGQPRRIKKILCESATDLGRERSFQGHGMLDVLRAFQKI
jgi:serine protease AprX